MLPSHLTYNLYTDGGVAGRNPSRLGGSWAWCLVNEKGKRVAFDSGVVTPSDILTSVQTHVNASVTVNNGETPVKAITNNLTELWAAVVALEAMPRNWAGILHTDSKVTWWRLTTSYKFNGIPAFLRQRCLSVRTGKAWTPVLIGGHPSASDLRVGYGKRGLPVSVHNVFVDKMCQKRARQLQEKGTVDSVQTNAER